MSARKVALDGPFSSDQAAELAVLVEKEACWENQRAPLGVPYTTEGLKDRQRVYEDYHSRLVKYNQRYAIAYVPESPGSIPLRLGRWCRALRDLYARVEGDTRVGCPFQVMEKAYRCADRISAIKRRAPVNRPGPLGTAAEAVGALDALSRWCDDLSNASVIETGTEERRPA